jgi:hypothetical protein
VQSKPPDTVGASSYFEPEGLYTNLPPSSILMTPRPIDAASTALYSLALVLGIILMPVALAMRKLGIAVPIDDLLDRLTTAYA